MTTRQLKQKKIFFSFSTYQAGEKCSPLIENRVRFNRRWSAQEKAKWCKDTYEYHTCATNYVINCTIGPVAADVAQLNVFLDYIEKSANRECPGGLYGCTGKSTNDTHCQDRVSYFLEKNALANHTTIASVPLLHDFCVFLILSLLMLKISAY